MESNRKKKKNVRKTLLRMFITTVFQKTCIGFVLFVSTINSLLFYDCKLLSCSLAVKKKQPKQLADSTSCFRLISIVQTAIAIKFDVKKKKFYTHMLFCNRMVSYIKYILKSEINGRIEGFKWKCVCLVFNFKSLILFY